MVNVNNVRVSVRVANRWELADEVAQAECCAEFTPWPLDANTSVCDFVYGMDVADGTRYKVGEHVRISHELPATDSTPGTRFARQADVVKCDDNHLTAVARWNGLVRQG
jgi:hypothetical protein